MANYASRIWATAASLACVPLYVGILGVEAYGLIGLFTLIQAALLLLDFGITPTMNRELARMRAGAHTPQTIHNLVRSVEVVALLAAAAMVCIGMALARPIAHGWLNPDRVTTAEIVSAVSLMGIVVSFRWIEQVYRACLTGAEDQVWLARFSIAIDTLRWFGAYFYLAWIDASVLGFFHWQLGVTLVAVIVVRFRINHLLPKSPKPPRFDSGELYKVRRYAAGMFVSSLLAFALTQFDKVFVSKFAPLSDFSAYMLAATVATGLLQLVTPLNAAIYPRMAEYVAARRFDDLEPLFMDASQWMSALVVPAACTLSVFSGQVLAVWTGNAGLALHGAPFLAILSLSMMLTGLMNVPYMLQLAHGWTSLSIRVNSAAIVLMAPVTFAAVNSRGAEGAAYASLGLSILTAMIGGHLMFNRLFPESRWHWLGRVVIVPVGVAALVATALAQLISFPNGRIQGGAVIVGALAIIQLATILCLPVPRRYAFARLSLLLARSPAKG